MVRAPDFWHRPGSILGWVLSPLGAVYGAIGRLRSWVLKRRQKKLPIPVICVGNLVMGGAGKTPTVQAILTFLQKNGHTPHIVLRGYGGSIKSVTRVDAFYHTYRDVGDEALLLSKSAPTWIGANRGDVGYAAFEAGASCLIFDDGFQNPAVFYDYSFLVIDQNYGFGNGHLFPAGPLRERPGDGFARASSVVLSGTGEWNGDELLPKTSLIWDYDPLDLGMIKGQNYVAFAGIGRPEKFFDALKQAGANLLAAIPFSDHHPFSVGDLTGLVALADRNAASLITTEKDYCRLPKNTAPIIQILRVRPRLDDVFLNTVLCGFIPAPAVYSD